MSQIFFCLLPGILALIRLPATNPAKQLIFLFVFFLLTGRRCQFRFSVSANHLASPSFPLPVSGDLRLLSTNICWYPLCDLHSFLTVTFLTGCHCSFQREDSINLISIVSVGYHVTNPHLREERDNRNTIKKSNSFHCSLSFSFPLFFFTLLFFYPLSSSRFHEFFSFSFFRPS